MAAIASRQPAPLKASNALLTGSFTSQDVVKCGAIHPWESLHMHISL